MGAWGPGPFENDGAADFLAELKSDPNPNAAVHAALLVVAESDGYLDVDDGQECVAACELVALGFEKAKAPVALGADEALRRLALEALPRVVDRENSELAQLWAESGDPDAFAVFEALHERLLTAGAGPTLGALDALLKPAAPPPRRPLPPPPTRQPEGPRPDVRAMIASSPALRATTIAHSDAWALTTSGVLNIYDGLSAADELVLDELRILVVQFARRFAVDAGTLAVVDALLEARPDAALRLVLNGHGAFDDLEVLAHLSNLRTVVLDGSEAFLGGLSARTVLAQFPSLERVVFQGQLIERGR